MSREEHGQWTRVGEGDTIFQSLVGYGDKLNERGDGITRYLAQVTG